MKGEWNSAMDCECEAGVLLVDKAEDAISQVIYCGGYSGEDPPLPIPNREVKLTSADGTAPPGGRVGSCRSSVPRSTMSIGELCFQTSLKTRRTGSYAYTSPIP